MQRLPFIVLLLSCFLASYSSKSTSETHQYNAEVINVKWMTGEFLPDIGIFILAGEQGSISYSSDGQNWHYSNTPITNTLHDIATDEAQRILVAVGDRGTILRSTNAGRVWHEPEIAVPDQVDISQTRINTVIYIPKSKVWLAAGTQNTILRSTDDALTWKLISYKTGSSQLEILELFADAKSGTAFFAAQHATTGRSVDGGLSWQINQHNMQTADSYIPHIVGYHQYKQTLIAAADSGRLLISKDNGLHWKLKKIPTSGYFTDSAFDSQHNVIALTTQMGEIAISKDDGNSWELITFKVKNWPSDDIPLLSKIVYDTKSQSFLVIGDSGIIARSGDGGQSWHGEVYEPLFNTSITTLLHDAKNGVFVVAGLGGSITRANKLDVVSRPINNWKVIRPGIDQYIRSVLHLPESNSFIAVGQLGGIWLTKDDGHTWQVINTPYPYPNQPPHLRDIVQDPESKALIAAGPAGSIIRSADDGMTWKAVFQGEIQKGEAFTQILYDSKTRAFYACEVLYRSVYQSLDGGNHWNKIATIKSGGRNLWYGVVATGLNLIMVIGEDGGIAISRDEGKNWNMSTKVTTSDLYGAYADNQENILFAVGEKGVILRSNNGMDWKLVDSGTTSTLRRIVKDQNSGDLFAFGQNGTILRSFDTGYHWSNVKAPDYAGELRTAVFEKDSKKIIIVGRDGGILRLADNGRNWERIESHTKQHFRSAAINPITGTVVVVGQGVVRLSPFFN
jgi:photosystem II stability/assembly factor-like uncharacterized protein